ncbi:S8 family serine peptidase [Deinococcus fonticola]|uniref:S8 family serine peptidase n=1 Tax=Deinococcus fonticola TaxID=2528713 RepID=UPI001075879E|nr:S8 family serine peptidase [Deinococcus fonticola]
MKRISLAALSLTALLAACQQQPTTPSRTPTLNGAHPTPDINLANVSVDARTGNHYVSDQLVVGLGGLAAQDIAAELGAKVIDRIPALDVAVLQLPNRNALELARRLSEEGRVSFAAPQQVWERPTYTKQGTSAELSPLAVVNQVFDELPQYALDSEHMNAKAAWDAGFTGQGVTVGVIDDPVDVSHPDLRANWGGKAYDPKADKTYTTVQSWIDAIDAFGATPMPVDNQVDQNIEHGTAVVSTIAAARDGKGIVGVAPDAKYFTAAMFQPGSVGSAGVAKAIVWMTDNGAKVINNSWGGAGYDPLIKLAMDYALARNVTVVVSAGNESREYYQRPALFAGVIPSAALAINNTKASFSTFGRHISVAAPGSDVLMTSPLFINEDGTRKTGATPPVGSGYILMSGTSFSGPYTSATAALILGARPDLDPYQVRRLMEETADGSIGENPSGFDKGTGYGRIDLGALAQRLKTGAMPEKGGALRVLVQFTKPDGTTTVMTQPSDVIIEKDGTNGAIYGAQTDNKGVAQFLAMAPGEYTIRVGGPDLTADASATLRGTYTGKVTITSGTTAATTPTVTITLDKGYVEPIVDTYEPNDTLQSASPITIGTRTNTALIYKDSCASTCTPATGDVDFYKFEGKAGQKLNITLFDKYHPTAPLGSMWGIVYIRDAQGVTLKDTLGKPLKPNLTTNILSVTLPADGTYYLQAGANSHLSPTNGEQPYSGTFANSKGNLFALEVKPQ